MKAQAAIVEYTNAAEQLPILQKEDDRSDAKAIEERSNSNKHSTTSVELFAQQTAITARFQESLSAIQDASQRQALVLQNSTQLLHELVRQWTVLGSTETTSAPEQHDAGQQSGGGKSGTVPLTKPMERNEEMGPQEQPLSSNTGPSHDAGASENIQIPERQRTPYVSVQAQSTSRLSAKAEEDSSGFGSESGAFGRSRLHQPPLQSYHSASPRIRSYASSSSKDEGLCMQNARIHPGIRPEAQPRPRERIRKNDGWEGQFPSTNYTKVENEQYAYEYPPPLSQQPIRENNKLPRPQHSPPLPTRPPSTKQLMTICSKRSQIRFKTLVEGMMMWNDDWVGSSTIIDSAQVESTVWIHASYPINFHTWSDEEQGMGYFVGGFGAE